MYGEMLFLKGQIAIDTQYLALYNRRYTEYRGVEQSGSSSGSSKGRPYSNVRKDDLLNSVKPLIW